MVERISFGPEAASPVEAYRSEAATAVHLGSGHGPSHVYAIHLGPGGEIGEHPTGFGQLFVVVAGDGWVRVDGVEQAVGTGEAVRLPRGVMHAKGSERGLTAIMVQIHELEPRPTTSTEAGQSP